MTRRLAVSLEALSDLEEIRQYTAEQSGEAQARAYLTGLREAFELLAVHPASGKAIAPGSNLRCSIYRRHRIVYRQRADRLEVGRVLHVARELEDRRALEVYLRTQTPGPER